MFCVGRCASSWGLKHTWELVPAVKSLQSSGDNHPGPRHHSLLFGRFQRPPDWSPGIYPCPLFCTYQTEESLQTHVSSALSLGSTLLFLSDLSPPSFPLGDGAVSILAFLLFLKQAKPTPTFMAPHLLSYGLGMLIYQRSTWLTPPSRLYSDVISMMPSLVALFETAASICLFLELFYSIAFPIIELYCVFYLLSLSVLYPTVSLVPGIVPSLRSCSIRISLFSDKMRHSWKAKKQMLHRYGVLRAPRKIL